MKKIILRLIRIYSAIKNSAFFSGSIFSQKSCRFYPTCSEYTYQAVEKYGSIKGVFLGFKRVIRCHPFSKGGYDPVG